MTHTEKLSYVVVILMLCAGGTAFAQSDEDSGENETGLTEVVVVTASRSEQNLNEVPAAMTVLSSAQLEQIPADDYGDLLRNVPGLNVSQMSARDVQVTGRGATNSLATSQLVVLDNRSLYLDFFGFVMWDFAPTDPAEIKQIEIVRGPGSAVWGANAMSGVIHMITKSPREMAGTTFSIGGGELGTLQGSVTHAGARDKIGYKISASYYEQDPYDRPTGTIPGSTTSYPSFLNQGTKQPKVNFRLDYDQNEDTTWSFSTGYAETDGIIHSGIGPFDIESGTYLSFAKIDWNRNAARVTFFANLLDGDALNQLTPLPFQFETETYNLDYSDTRLAGTKNVLTFGATVRQNQFDLSIASRGDSRNEFGVFLQDEIRFNDKVTWLIGARWDDLDVIDPVVSPRTSLLIRPRENHSIRASFNRAFRAPSLVQNFLETTIFNQVLISDPALSLAGISPFAVTFSSDALGNENLIEESVDAIEVGYVGDFGSTTFTASVYRNETTDSIDFFTAAPYPLDPADPPDFLPILDTDLAAGAIVLCTAGTPAEFCTLPVPGSPTLYDVIRGSLPGLFSYRNIGETVDTGVELTLDIRPNDRWSYSINYSWQDEPDVTGIPQETLPDGTVRDAVNTPPEHRANLGLAYTADRWNFSGNINYNDDAFWTDVLDSRFWGPTDSFTMVNLAVGVNLSDNVKLTVNAQNAFDEDVQQHVFGDLLSRKVSGRLNFRF